MGLSARCGRCRCECAGATTDGDVVRNRNRNNDDPDAVLEGLAMAGLVVILRQLGDLAELAAEVFDDMQDQVMAASARGRRLAVRARRLLEADLDLGAGRLGSRAQHMHLRGRGVAGGGGTPPPPPRLVVQRIRRCRGPPKLSLLDKFDAAGEGACLKRYTDPSFFFRAHHSAKLEIRVRAANEPMETSRPKFQTRLNSEPPEPAAHSVTDDDCKSETETETGAGSPFLRMQQAAAVHRVESSPQQQLNMEQKLQGGGGGGGTDTAQPPSSPSELERTGSFEAWLPPDAHRFPTTAAAAASGSVSHLVTSTSNADAALGSSAMLKATQNSASDAEIMPRNKVKGSVEMMASRVCSLPRKLFSNIKHHNDCPSSHRAGSSLQISQATGIACSPELAEAITNPRQAFLPVLLHSDPVYSNSYMHSLLSVDAKEDPSTSQCSNSNSSTPETCTTPDSRNLLFLGSLVLKRAQNSSSEDAKVDTAPPLPPIPPMQWLPEKVHTDTGTRAASPKHRALCKTSLEVGRADRSNDALHSVTTQVAEKIQAISHSIQASPVDTEEPLVSAENNTSVNTSHGDEMKCSEETTRPQPFRVQEDAVQASSEGNVLKAGEFPVPAILSDEAWSEIDLRTQKQADKCFQQQAREQSGSSGQSQDKRSEEHKATDDSSNVQNECVFFSAVQELAKMSPPPSLPKPKHSLLDAGSHGRITLRNGPSLIHPSRNILDSRSVLIEQIKDIATAGNPSFKLKPVSGASSPVIGSPTNSKMAHHSSESR